MFEIQKYDTDTRRLMSEAVERVRDEDHNRFVLRLVIAQAFIAQAASALSVEQIVRTGTAIVGYMPTEQTTVGVQKELTAMVREKALRSRRAGAACSTPSLRLYEVNY